jgi:hypothetical protein
MGLIAERGRVHRLIYGIPLKQKKEPGVSTETSKDCLGKKGGGGTPTHRLTRKGCIQALEIN